MAGSGDFQHLENELNSTLPLSRIPVGVVVERRKATSPWADSIWRPIAVLPGQPDTPAWTKLNEKAGVETFYVGTAEIELYRTAAAFYGSNLMSGTPTIWIAVRATGCVPAYTITAVTADPTEGESMTEIAADLVDQVPMPMAIHQVLAAFVAEHYVEENFIKRKRDRPDPEALARRGPRRREHY
jgi:hypothetical protein